MSDEEITESDYYDGKPCKCGHFILDHVLDGEGYCTEAGCPCTGYEESEP